MFREVKYVIYVRRPEAFISTLHLGLGSLRIKTLCKVDIIRTKDSTRLSLLEERTILRLSKLKQGIKGLPQIDIDVNEIKDLRVMNLKKSYLRHYEEVIARLLKAREDEEIYVMTFRVKSRAYTLILKKDHLYVVKRFLKESGLF